MNESEIKSLWETRPPITTDEERKSAAELFLKACAFAERIGYTPPPEYPLYSRARFVTHEMMNAADPDAWKFIHKNKVDSYADVFEFKLVHYFQHPFVPPDEILDDAGNVDYDLVRSWLPGHESEYERQVVPLTMALESMINEWFEYRNDPEKLRRLYARVRIWFNELNAIKDMELFEYLFVKRDNQVQIVMRYNAQFGSRAAVREDDMSVKSILGPYFREFSKEADFQRRGWFDIYDATKPQSARNTKAPLPNEALANIRAYTGTRRPTSRWR